MIGILNKGSFAVFCKEELEADANVTGGRLFPSFKNTETQEPAFKAIFVVQGQTDTEKDILDHNPRNIRQNSVCILI